MNHGIAWRPTIPIVDIRTNRARYLGNMLQFRIPSSYGDYEFKWFKIYGPVYRLKGCFGQNRLMVADLLACQHILKSPHFALSPTLDNTLRMAVGDGTMIRMRGKAHQRLEMDSIRDLPLPRPAAFSQSLTMSRRLQITQELELSGTAPIDIVPPLGIATFTAIAGAALGYSLDDLGEEYVAATARYTAWKASHLAQSIGAQVVKEKHDLVQQGLNTDGDIFGILLDQVHSNTERIPLTGEEIVKQTQTIMTAGQETTTKTIAFGLRELAKDPELQESLRAEIHSSPGEVGQNGAYDQMPLLNAFIKETLRLYPAEAFTERMVVEDTIIPLLESITTSTGEQISEIFVSKGQVVIVGIASYQRPSRWFEDTILNADAVGPYANLWRFAILEMQAVICELVGKFAFTLPENDSVRNKVVWREVEPSPKIAKSKKIYPELKEPMHFYAGKSMHRITMSDMHDMPMFENALLLLTFYHSFLALILLLFDTRCCGSRFGLASSLALRHCGIVSQPAPPDPAILPQCPLYNIKHKGPRKILGGQVLYLA
ncbi:cytochrome P450 [Mycena olivaceomarginata]|nr:cytochrome P450 [Mycena olivaceomarginata]